MIERLRVIHGLTPRTFARYLLLMPLVVLCLSVIAEIGLLIPSALAAGLGMLSGS